MQDAKTATGPSRTELKNLLTAKRFVVVGILFIGIMVAYLDRVNVAVLVANDGFLTDMGIHNEPVKIGMLTAAFLLAYGIANVALSPLGDYWGPRKTMLICISLWMIAAIVGGLSTEFAVMILARILLGIGQGLYYPMQSVFIRNWFPLGERGRANAVWSIGQSLAPAIAMPFFSFIVGEYGWRESFAVCLLFCFIPAYLLWRYTADTPRLHKTINAAERELIEGGITVSGEAAERQAKETVWQRIRPFVFDYRYWLLVYWYVSLNFIYWGLVSWLPSYLKVVRGFSWGEMGWMASLPFVLTVITKAGAGLLSDRMEKKECILMVSMLLGSICIYFATLVPGKYPAAILIACAFGFTSMGTPVAWTLLQGLVAANSMTIAAGMMNGIATGLASIAPILIGYLIGVTGEFSSGLLGLTGAGMLAAASATILWRKNKLT